MDRKNRAEDFVSVPEYEQLALENVGYDEIKDFILNKITERIVELHI